MLHLSVFRSVISDLVKHIHFMTRYLKVRYMLKIQKPTIHINEYFKKFYRLIKISAVAEVFDFFLILICVDYCSIFYYAIFHLLLNVSSIWKCLRSTFLTIIFHAVQYLSFNVILITHVSVFYTLPHLLVIYLKRVSGF